VTANHTLRFTLDAASGAGPSAVDAALPPLPLSDAARGRACALLGVEIGGQAHLPQTWQRFDEEACQFLTRGHWRDDGRLDIEAHIWTAPSPEPDLLFGGPGDWSQVAAQHPEQAAELLACIHAAARDGSTVTLAYEIHGGDQIQRAVSLTAFARAALPPRLRERCAAVLPLGSPRKLVEKLGVTVVAYPTGVGGELAEAYALASARGGVLFSMTEGRSAGMEPNDYCRAYAEAAVGLAASGRQAVLRFAHKAGLQNKTAFREAARVAKLLNSPGGLTATVRQWAVSGEPDAFAALLEDDDWRLLDVDLLAEIGRQTLPPVAGGALQAGALRELARRPDGATRADLLPGTPSDPAALAHAGRLIRAGLPSCQLSSQWIEPVAQSLQGAALEESLRASLAQGSQARELSLALMARAQQAPSRALAPILADADRAGRFDDFDLALAAERAYAACAGTDLGRLEAFLEEQRWSVAPPQRRVIVAAALSRTERGVGPKILFFDGRLRVSGDWLEEIVACLESLAGPDRAELSVAEWASLWSAVADRDELRERLLPRLDERMALSTAALTKALVATEAWPAWKALTKTQAAVRDRSSLEWLASRGPRTPYLEEWKLALEGLRTLSAERLRRLSAGAGDGSALFDTIPYFEPEQTADLIRLAPDDDARALWAELLERFPNTDPYRRDNESAFEYVLAAGDGNWDEPAGQRWQALRLAAEGDWRSAEEHWPALKQLSAVERAAVAAIGALRRDDPQNPCWDQLAALSHREALSTLLCAVRQQLSVSETAGLAAPLLRVLAQRPRWLGASDDGVPALELLATLRSRTAIVLPAFEIARLAAEHGYSDRADWWRLFVAQARDCPRHDGRPQPLESWAHSRTLLYNRAASLPARAALHLRRALSQESSPLKAEAASLEPTSHS
jgi:hypothetical protein